MVIGLGLLLAVFAAALAPFVAAASAALPLPYRLLLYMMLLYLLLLYLLLFLMLMLLLQTFLGGFGLRGRRSAGYWGLDSRTRPPSPTEAGGATEVASP